jgi:Protein of unknown function
MDRSVAKQILAACENALTELTKIEHAAREIKDESERRGITRSLSVVIADVLGTIRAPVIRQFPELVPPGDPGEPDNKLGQEEQELLSALLAADLDLIDRTLLEECASSWRKVARVVMSTMNRLKGNFPNLPPALYSQRVALLVHSGSLESQGNLSYMRFSEVKLASSARGAA